MAPWDFCCSRIGVTSCLRYWSSVGGRVLRLACWRYWARSLSSRGKNCRRSGLAGLSMAGMAAIWAARVGSMEGDWAWVTMVATEKRAAEKVYRIAFIDIGLILRAGQRIWDSR